MSNLVKDLEAAMRMELATPQVRNAIEGVEHAALEAAKNAMETVLPAPIRALVGGLLDALAEKGIVAIEHFTDEALLGLGAVKVVTPVATATITMFLTPHSDSVHSIADLPEEARPK